MGQREEQAFRAGEGDRWFERNSKSLSHPAADDDRIMRLLDLYGLRPRSVLEIGAANGYRLAAIAQRAPCRAVAVEPSRAAIDDGRSRFPGVEFHEGLAHELPTRDRFDLVIVSFVLHWVGRENLLRAVAEIDRSVADGGHLAIADFAPPGPTRTRYHHLPDEELFTWKQDYAALFVATGLYEAIASVTGPYDSGVITDEVADRDRAAAWLLRRRVGALYRPSDPT